MRFYVKNGQKNDSSLFGENELEENKMGGKEREREREKDG